MRADGTIVEILILDETRLARIVCPLEIIPAAGQFVMAHSEGADDSLATALFTAKVFTDPGDSLGIGFLGALPLPANWIPGTRLHLRGPLGHGFSIPPSARRIALIGLNPVLDIHTRGAFRSLFPLLTESFKQNALVTIICEYTPEDLPLQVEVQPLSALDSICKWADYIACEGPRELVSLFKGKHLKRGGTTQVLINVPMPCGGLAECGVCTVEALGGQMLTCKEGPVFELNRLLG